jgi:hypothetical protein
VGARGAAGFPRGTAARRLVCWRPADRPGRSKLMDAIVYLRACPVAAEEIAAGPRTKFGRPVGRGR